MRACIELIPLGHETRARMKSVSDASVTRCDFRDCGTRTRVKRAEIACRKDGRGRVEGRSGDPGQ